VYKIQNKELCTLNITGNLIKEEEMGETFNMHGGERRHACNNFVKIT
jgi:hypothetical protein